MREIQSPHPRLPRLLKWAMIGCLVLAALIILPLLCLVVSEFLNAGKPIPLTPIKLALLASAQNARDETGNTQSPPYQALAVGTLGADKSSTSELTMTRKSNAFSSETRPGLKFKPLIKADSVWGRTLVKDRDRVNGRFDAILDRIAKYEAARANMKPGSPPNGVEFNNIAKEFNKITDELEKLLPGQPPFGDSGEEASLWLKEFVQWQFIRGADFHLQWGRYAGAAESFFWARSWKMNEWRQMTGTNKSISELFRSQEYQILWRQEMALWRQAGGFTGLKGITQSVLEREGEKLAGIIQKVISSGKNPNVNSQ